MNWNELDTAATQVCALQHCTEALQHCRNTAIQRSSTDDESQNDDYVEETIENFKDTWKKYGERIVFKLSKERPNLEILKAVKSAPKVMMKSLKSQTKTLSDQLRDTYN